MKTLGSVEPFLRPIRWRISEIGERGYFGVRRERGHWDGGGVLGGRSALSSPVDQ